MLEAGEVTTGQSRKMRDKLEEDFRLAMSAEGRGLELLFLDATPYEKLELAGELPAAIGIFGPDMRWYKEDLLARKESPGTIKGKQIVAPFYNKVEALFYSDPRVREAIQSLGINLQDEDTLDNIMPWLFFGYSGER